MSKELNEEVGRRARVENRPRKEEFPRGVWQEVHGSQRVAQVVREG